MRIEHDVELNLIGEKCPKPIIMARHSLKAMLPGQILKVISTDPMSVDDFQIFAKMNNIKIVEQQQNDGKYCFYLKKNG